MASRAVDDRPDTDEAPPSQYRPRREAAPSFMRTEDPTVARWMGMAGLLLFTVGSMALLATRSGFSTRISVFWASLFGAAGLLLLLLHAAFDRDMQVRRTYGVLGYMWVLAGIIVTIIPIRVTIGKDTSLMQYGLLFLPWGFLCMSFGLAFLLAYLRHEDDPKWRRTSIRVIGLVGAVTALTGLIGGLLSQSFLMGADTGQPYGLVLALIGLAYLWAFVAVLGVADDLGYRVGWGIGLLGAVTILIALGRSALPPLFYSFGSLATRPGPYFVPSGISLAVLGFLYIAVSLSLCSDSKFIVLCRRELASFFYSPIAYIVLLILSLVAAFVFWMFIQQLASESFFEGPLPEPVITRFLLNLLPVFFLLVCVPALTMRLFSEENRTGTIEVLLTAPLDEVLLVLSKFTAVFIVYLACWIPWGLYLIAFRAEGGQPFEYRPMLVFYFMIACTGAGFLSMGLFFSSLTRNQIIAFMTTCGAMLFLTGVFWAKAYIEQGSRSGGALASLASSGIVTILTHISYLDLWISSLDQAEITPKFYVYHLSAAVFWLFATVKVLESRKWR